MREREKEQEMNGSGGLGGVCGVDRILTMSTVLLHERRGGGWGGRER